MKKLTNLKGVKTLDKAKQKSIDGGRRPGANCNCSGKPNGSACFYGCHVGCPGECSSGNCIPYQQLANTVVCFEVNSKKKSDDNLFLVLTIHNSLFNSLSIAIWLILQLLNQTLSRAIKALDKNKKKVIKKWECPNMNNSISKPMCRLSMG